MKLFYKLASSLCAVALGMITLTGCEGRLHYTQAPRFSFGLYADYYWYEMGDIICLGGNDTHYFCFPRGGEPVAKIRLAAEEMYKLHKSRRLPTPDRAEIL